MVDYSLFTFTILLGLLPPKVHFPFWEKKKTQNSLTLFLKEKSFSHIYPSLTACSASFFRLLRDRTICYQDRMIVIPEVSGWVQRKSFHSWRQNVGLILKGNRNKIWTTVLPKWRALHERPWEKSWQKLPKTTYFLLWLCFSMLAASVILETD